MWASFKTNKNDYNTLSEHYFGKNINYLLDVSKILLICGFLICYNILIPEFIDKALVDFGVDPKYFDPDTNSRLYHIIILNVVMIPIFLLRDLSSLKFFSLVGLGSVIYTIILICF